MQPALDGFEILRRGDINVNCRIILHIQHYPERFKVLNPLGDLVAMKEGTRAEVMAGVWKLVKIAGAQDKEDSTIIRPIGGLEKVSSLPDYVSARTDVHRQLVPAGHDGIQFHNLPNIINQFLTHPDPVTIPYTIQWVLIALSFCTTLTFASSPTSVDQDYNFHPQCFDIPVELEDPLKSKMAGLISTFEGEEGQEIVKLEDKVGELAYFARDLKQKRDFLESFAYVRCSTYVILYLPTYTSTNPQIFIQNWLAAQARDLDSMLGYQVGNPAVNGGNIREEDLRRSDLFNMPWVDEAINIHEASRMEAERRGAR